MKAIEFDSYGGPEVLELREREAPTAGPGQVRVRVRATSVNAADYRMMRADPFLARLGNGLLRPKKYRVLGVDVAGVVESVGPDVTRWKVGDEVFGDAYQDGMGAFAELVCVREGNLARVPEGVSFEEAAALPVAAVTALRGLRDKGGVTAGSRVLIQGAGGGVGTFCVQIAKALGAHVTAVCGARSVDLVQASGADVVLDYAEEDFVERGEQYDVIVGVNGHRTLSEYKRCLAPGGRYVMLGGDNKQIFAALLLGPLRFMFSGKKCLVLNIEDTPCGDDLRQLAAMVTAGELKPVIDRDFPLEEIADAFRHVERKHTRGKVVVAVA